MLEVGGFKSEFLFLMNVQGAKSAKKSVNYLGKVDIGMSQTSLAARLVFLKPRWQRCRDSKILVTMAFWEADSRHAGELSVFFLAKKSSCH